LFPDVFFNLKVEERRKLPELFAEHLFDEHVAEARAAVGAAKSDVRHQLDLVLGQGRGQLDGGVLAAAQRGDAQAVGLGLGGAHGARGVGLGVGA